MLAMGKHGVEERGRAHDYLASVRQACLRYNIVKGQKYEDALILVLGQYL